MPREGTCELIDGVLSGITLEDGKVARHRHVRSYVAVVLEGGYQEAGDEGRFSLRAGDALVHRPFEAHKDDIAPRGAKILNLPGVPARGEGLRFTVPDPDALAALASLDLLQAAALFAEAAIPSSSAEDDWPDLLANRLRSLSAFRLADWADQQGLAPETISRGFAKAYGVAPHLYRAEARARRAVEKILTTQCGLSHISAELGFCDQPHMTRAVQALTGCSPGYWRKLKGVAPREARPRKPFAA